MKKEIQGRMYTPWVRVDSLVKHKIGLFILLLSLLLSVFARGKGLFRRGNMKGMVNYISCALE